MILALLIVALICFILAVVPPTSGAFSWVPLELAFWVLSVIVGHGLH